MEYTITRANVQRHAAELLGTCLGLKDYSPTCTAMTLLHVLFTACSRLGSLSAACWSLATAPSREFKYQSLDAGRFRNRVEDILAQLFGHSSYHCG